MDSSYMTDPAIFVIDSLFSLYILAVLLRFLLQWCGADFYNPISQFLVKATHPPLRTAAPLCAVYRKNRHLFAGAGARPANAGRFFHIDAERRRDQHRRIDHFIADPTGFVADQYIHLCRICQSHTQLDESRRVSVPHRLSCTA